MKVLKHAREPSQRQRLPKIQAVGSDALAEHLQRTARPCWLCKRAATLVMVRHPLHRSRAERVMGPEVCGLHLKAVWPLMPKDEIWIATEHPQAQLAKMVSARRSAERRRRASCGRKNC